MPYAEMDASFVCTEREARRLIINRFKKACDNNVIRSHDPVSRNPVFACGEHSDGGQEFLIRYINILVDDGGIKIMTIQLLNAC